SMNDRPLADDAAQGKVLHRMRAALPAGIDAGREEHTEQLGARQPVPTAQCTYDNTLDGGELGLAQTELPVAGRGHTQLPLTGHAQHPCEIFGRDDVQRAPLRPSTYEHAAVEQPIDVAQSRRARR